MYSERERGVVKEKGRRGGDTEGGREETREG
jgi:hypothetical protein